MGQADIPNQPEIHQPVEQPLPDAAGYAHLARHNEDGSYNLSLMVRGVHCAACIQKIESTLKRDQNIRQARLNFSTGRLSIQWDGAPDQANDYAYIVEDQGYEVLPYDAQREDSATKQEERFLLLCLGVAGFAMGNIMLLSVGLWTTTTETMGGATRDFLHWISAAIALPTILFSGRPFFHSSYKALVKGQTNMDVPISVALLLAGGMSLFGVITHSEHVYFDSAVMLMFFLLIGRYLDFRARKTARANATSLLGTLSGFANVVDGQKMRRVPVSDLKEGTIVRLAAGTKCPIDGKVARGQSAVDTALITGESMPRDIKPGDAIYAGSINMGAPLDVRVIKCADDSLLADVIRLMEKAEQGQAKYVRVADRAARLYTPVVHFLALLAFIGWVTLGDLAWQQALMIAITVLIITCPCALGLAVPVVQVLATGRLIKKGVLVKSGDALERLAVIDTVMLDKTGTLTLGKPVLSGAYDPEDLKLAASLTAHSTHPLSRALSQAYDGSVMDIDTVQEFSGQGLQAIRNKRTVRLGSRLYCGVDSVIQDEAMELWLNRGDSSAPCRFTFTDQLRTDAQDIIAAFQNDHIKTIMVSGDRKEVASHMAEQCGIDEFYAELTPPQKYDILERLKKSGRSVLMVGDGLNDAPVLSGADVSMAPGSAIDLTQNAADIVFMGDHLAPVYETHKTARLTQKLVKQNFGLAILYNCIAIPFALAGLVTPLGAALAMSGSSVLVIANAFRLKLKR